MLCFDPTNRVTVPQALEHPWLSAYHDPIDEPDCPVKFDQWREIETLETMEEFREALWNEIEDYRREVRGLDLELSALSGSPLSSSPSKFSTSPENIRLESSSSPSVKFDETIFRSSPVPLEPEKPSVEIWPNGEVKESTRGNQRKEADDVLAEIIPSLSPESHRRSITTPTDPVVTYARRSSIMQPSRQGSTYNSPIVGSHVPAFVGDGTANADKLGQNTMAFPTQGYVIPARSRTGSTTGGEVTRRLLRTLSTVSIHESVEGLPGGLAGIAPIGKFITEVNTEADAPPSEVPKDFGLGSPGEEDKDPKKPSGRFHVG